MGVFKKPVRGEGLERGDQWFVRRIQWVVFGAAAAVLVLFAIAKEVLHIL